MQDTLQPDGAVKARVRYLNPEWKGRAERPSIYSRETRRANTRFYDVEIADARPLAERGELDLDVTGFALFRHRSQVADFHDPGLVRLFYYPEISSLYQRLTGAEHVFFLHHLLRTETPASFEEAYARYVHCDYSANYVGRMARRLFAKNGLSEDEASRYDFVWLNAWQPIDREVQQNPLAVIDSRTLAEDDVIEYSFGDDGDYAQASMPVYSTAHRHYYFPRMQTDELLLTKQFDSRPSRARFCPHTSFDDPTSPADAIPRRSIELRAMCALPR